MEIMLTKDGDELICFIYKEYLNRRRQGLSKREAGNFAAPETWASVHPSGWTSEDLRSTLEELGRASLLKTYLRSGFQLKDEGVIYMEKRFPDGVSQVLDWLAKIKAVIPSILPFT